MDINQFLLNNASAVMGLLGAIIGSIFTSVPFIVFQLLQRKWQIEDERRRWRRDRLLSRLSPIQDWLDKTLRFTQAFTQWFNDPSTEKQPSNFIDVAEDDLRQNFQEQSLIEAIVWSHAVSTGDHELLSLIKEFKKLRGEYFEALTANDNSEIEASRFVLEAIASKTGRRIEFLLEQAQPIGGNYHDKSIFRFFRIKVRSQKRPVYHNVP